MKLLIDENLPPALAPAIADLFPGSIHVSEAGLSATPDSSIWSYAKSHGYTLLTKDHDFESISLTRGLPPKVVVLDIGNCSTAQVETIIRANSIRFAEFDRDSHRSLLILKRANPCQPKAR